MERTAGAAEREGEGDGGGAVAAAAEAECEQPAGEVPVHESWSTAGTSNSVENAEVTWMAADQLIPCGVLNVVQGA